VIDQGRISIAQRAVSESFTTTPCEAVYTAKSGEQSRGSVTVYVTPTSIRALFEDISTFEIPEERYGEPGGALAAADGSWRSAAVTFTGTSAAGARLFSLPEVLIDRANAPVAFTRVVLAGTRVNGVTSFGGRASLFHSLTPDATSHHDGRVAVTIEGTLSPAERDTLAAIVSFAAGIATPILSVEQYAADDTLVNVAHYRGYRRVGRFPHSPFPDDDAVRLRAITMMSDGIGPLRESGFPADIVLDQIAGSNVVAQIHLSSQLLMLAVQTVAHYLAPEGADHTAAFANLVATLKLTVIDPDFTRLNGIRGELLDRGYFGAPGYETGRPQRDIKFVRDIAHTSMFRLCGYTGPFWSSERFRVETFD
jgi:hypothetical protein